MGSELGQRWTKASGLVRQRRVLLAAIVLGGSVAFLGVKELLLDALFGWINAELAKIIGPFFVPGWMMEVVPYIIPYALIVTGLALPTLYAFELGVASAKPKREPPSKAQKIALAKEGLALERRMTEFAAARRRLETDFRSRAWNSPRHGAEAVHAERQKEDELRNETDEMYYRQFGRQMADVLSRLRDAGKTASPFGPNISFFHGMHDAHQIGVSCRELLREFGEDPALHE